MDYDDDDDIDHVDDDDDDVNEIRAPHPPTEGDVPGHCKVVQLDEVGDRAKPLEELGDRLEVLGA